MTRRNRRVRWLFACLSMFAAVVLVAPSAQAQPGCTSTGLSSALAQVAGGTATFLSSHPEAEAAVDSANENTIRTYFVAHPDQWSQLQGIAAPLRSLRASCPQQVAPADIARLFDAMAS